MNAERRTPNAERSSVALNRALSKLGILSRAQATVAIRAGRVTVDGRIVTDPARLVVPERAQIAVDGVPRARVAWRTILLHKPRGVVTTRRDPRGRQTVFDLIDDCTGLTAVGRLDFATSGLLVLTTDTRLANWMTDPANAVSRLYVVTVRGQMTADDLAALGAGTILRKTSGRESHLTVELRQGRNREIRKRFAAIGRDVTRLKRVRFGGLELDVPEPGRWREATRDEIAAAFPGAPVRASCGGGRRPSTAAATR